MSRYDTILFDLDGTLTDSGPGMINSVIYALDKCGIRVEDRASLEVFIGPPMRESFQRFYGFSPEQAEQATLYSREYYSATGIFENSVYDGVYEMLDALKAAGKRLLLATAKPEEFALRVLEHFDLAKYFEFCGCALMDGSRVNKVDIIDHVLRNCGITSPEGVVMVGDREHDILGAKARGLDSIGVLYGFGDRGEFEAAGATWIVETAGEVVSIVLG